MKIPAQVIVSVIATFVVAFISASFHRGNAVTFGDIFVGVVFGGSVAWGIVGAFFHAEPNQKSQENRTGSITQADASQKGEFIASQSQPTASPASSQSTKTCPKCAEKIMVDALVCRYCGHEFSKSEWETTKQALLEQMERNAKQAKEKSLRNWGWVFAIFGVLLILISVCFLSIFILSGSVAKTMQTNGVEVAMITFVFCTMPEMAIGIGLLLLGIKRLRVAPTIENKENLER
jgi:hypothetical protein